MCACSRKHLPLFLYGNLYAILQKVFSRNCDKYVYKRELRVLERQGKKVWVVLAESESTPSIPEKSGVVRVDDYKQCAALTSDGKVGTKGEVTPSCAHTPPHHLPMYSCETKTYMPCCIYNEIWGNLKSAGEWVCACERTVCVCERETVNYM